MKKKLVFIASLLVLAFTLFACTNDPKKFTVTFDSMQGSTVASETVDEGSLVTKPTDPTRVDFDFKGWFKESSLNNEWKFAEDKVTANITLYAKWEAKEAPVVEKVKVTFHLNYSGSAPATIVEIDKGTAVTKVADPTRTNYAFKGWSETQNGTTPFVFTTLIQGDKTLYAIWETTQQTVLVTFDADNETTDVVVTAIVGQALVPPTDPVKGTETFLGWFNGETLWNIEDTVTQAMTLKAKYSARDGIAISSPQQFVDTFLQQTVTEGVYYLTNDIDFTGITIPQPKAKSEFEAEFDGQGFTIKNFTAVATEADARAGIFGIIKNAKITNLVIENANISAYDRAGILAAEIIGGAGVLTIIDNVTILNSVVKGSNKDNAAGGLVGYVNADATIANVSLFNVNVEAVASPEQATPKGAGGLFARTNNGVVTISNVFVNASVKGFDHVGGLVGVANKDLKGLTINNAVVIVTVEGTNYVTGIVGRQQMTGAEALLTLTNVVADVIIKGEPGNYTGYFTGRLEENKLETVRNNVFISVDGVEVGTGNEITETELVEQADTFYDAAWFTANQPDIVASELWVTHTSGLRVLKSVENATIAKAEYFTLTLVVWPDYEVEIKIRKGLSQDDVGNPPRENFEFVGWFVDEVEFDFTAPVLADITVTAKWEPITVGQMVLTGEPVITENNQNIHLTFELIVNDARVNINTTNMSSAFVIYDGTRNELELTAEGTTVTLDVLLKGRVTFEFFDKDNKKIVATVSMDELVNEAYLQRTGTEVGQLIEGESNYYIEYDVVSGPEILQLVEGKVLAVYQINETNGLGWSLRNVFGTDPNYLQLATGETGIRRLLVVDAESNLHLVEHEHIIHYVVTITIEETEVRVFEHGQPIELPMTTENGTIIEGWFRDEDFSEEWLGGTVEETLTLFAKVTEKESFEVFFTWAELDKPISVFVLDGSQVNLETVVNEGFNLIGLYLDELHLNVFDVESPIVASITIYVEWQAVQFIEHTETFDLVTNIDNGFFTIGAIASNQTMKNDVTFEGVTYTSKQNLKLNSGQSVTFTTEYVGTVIRIIISERKTDDFGQGRVRIMQGEVEVARKTLELIGSSTETELTGENIQVLEFTLTEAGTFTILQSQKEMVIFAVQVIELRQN